MVSSPNLFDSETVPLKRTLECQTAAKMCCTNPDHYRFPDLIAIQRWKFVSVATPLPSRHMYIKQWQ